MFEDLLKEIEATEEERRPTPGQAAAVSTPAIPTSATRPRFSQKQDVLRF
jgi:hypothetical protein